MNSNTIKTLPRYIWHSKSRRALHCTALWWRFQHWERQAVTQGFFPSWWCNQYRNNWPFFLWMAPPSPDRNTYLSTLPYNSRQRCHSRTLRCCSGRISTLGPSSQKWCDAPYSILFRRGLVAWEPMVVWVLNYDLHGTAVAPWTATTSKRGG